MLQDLISGDTQALIQNLLRAGEVTSVEPAKMTARVRFEDRDNVESYDLRLVVPRALKNKDFDCPDVGENVLCLFLPSGVETGFIIGSYYPETVTPPDSSQNKKSRVFEDGSRVSYDRDSNTLDIDLSSSNGTVNITCQNANITASGEAVIESLTATVQGTTSVTIDSPLTSVTGALNVTGPASLLGGVVVAGVSALGGAVTIGGAATLSGAMTVTGPTALLGPFAVAGMSASEDGVEFTAGMNVTGDVSITGDSFQFNGRDVVTEEPEP